ncbi:MAG TPA: hypothetical protein VEG60_30820 [Candidatus Binatia bacterium]|nr:hypothetical protein [Candidatus Binatia bacterium]
MGARKPSKYKDATHPTRLEDKLGAEEKKKALIERMLARGKRPEPVADPPVERPVATNSADESRVPPTHKQPQPESPFAKARYGNAGVAVLDRSKSTERLCPDPWLAKLVNAALDAADKRQGRLALVWPGGIRSVALIHVLATIERFAIGDKRGLRALLFPTKRSSFAALNQLLLDRDKLLEWANRYLTVTEIAGTSPPIEGRDDQNKDMLLMAVLTAKNQDPALAPPSIAELFSHFDWDLNSGGWGHYGERFLKRTKRALQRAHRRDLWNADDGRIAKLGNPQSAPDALFGVSHLANAGQWKAALKSRELSDVDFQPELVLFDLTSEIRRTTERNLIRLVPEVIDEIHEHWNSPPGYLIVTDDPKTYFILRKQLVERIEGDQGAVVCDSIVSVREDFGLSAAPFPIDWVPPAVSNKHFHVGVLDQEVAAEVSRFWNIAQDLEPDSPAHRALRQAAAFLLRFANLPGGYRDYIGWMEASAFSDSIRSDMTWNGHMAALQRLEELGEFGDKTELVRRTVSRATKLVEAYDDETPIAKRIAKEVSLCASKHKASVTVAMRFNSDIPVAKAFLARYDGFPDGQPFSTLADRVEFINHREVSDLLASGKPPTKFIFVGMPDDTLKTLLTSERVPANSVVLLDWRRANDVLIGLRALKTVDAFKPFRGRISEFGDEIERRIKELPKAIDIEKLGTLRVRRLSLSAAASEASRRADSPPNFYRVELEGEQRIVVGNKVYVYDPDEERPFQQRNIEQIQVGDVVFVMSDELKDLFESCLIQAGNPIARGSSFGEMLRNYHHDVLTNSKRIFGELQVAALARKIHKRMVEINPATESCNLSRIRYWLDVEKSLERTTEDLKPHSTWSRTDYETFARALEIPENLINVYWLMVTGQRKALQQAGREIAERYAHVLFNEESAKVLYRLPDETIMRLQHEAVRNTHQVVKIIPPDDLTETVGGTRN